jgi:orotidine-5'-phosphate decarboxylase
MHDGRSFSSLPLNARDCLILALDFSSAAPALDFLTTLRQRTANPPRWVKVGLELFLAEGRGFIEALRSEGYSIFLDLKLHDIPNTVASAIRVLGPLRVDLLTVHAAGGPAMLAAAAEAVAGLACPPRLLAVTVLTSMDRAQLAAIGVSDSPPEQVLRLARAARLAGIDGLVASPLEAAMLRESLHEEPARPLHLVTPGIRTADDRGGDDQQRTATPWAALAAGANQLVVGRPITRAADPAAAYEAILSKIEAALQSLGHTAKSPA